jgi:hypothetical protein
MGMSEKSRHWEQMGAASGMFAVLVFVAAFLIFLNTDPSGGNTPRLPNIGNAVASPAFFADHLNGIRAQVMLNGIGMVFFLWFLGTLWGALRGAEGEPARGSTIATAGAVVGVSLTLVGLVMLGTATMTSTLEQAQTVPTLYAGGMLALAFGGAAFTIFYLGVAEVILRTGVLGKWLGLLALVAAAVSVFGFVTPYAQDGIFNAATGALGFYAHYIAFVVWLLCASAAMTIAQHRRSKAEAPATPAAPGGAEGAGA